MSGLLPTSLDFLGEHSSRAEGLSPLQDGHNCLRSYARNHPDDVVALQDPVPDGEALTALAVELARRGRHPVIASTVAAPQGASALVGNIFASRDRIARMLGVPTVDLHSTYEARSADPLACETVGTGPVADIVLVGEEVDVRQLPVPTHFASDQGPYVTSGIIIAVDPDTGHGNMSYHRAMVHSPTEFATSLHSRGDLWRMLRKYGERGRPMPVAMVIGCHPLVMLAASARVPYDMDERWIAGALLGEPLQVVNTPVHGIGVPAWSEFVIEGTIDVADHADEGPFGEFSGYSSYRSTNNLLRVDAVMHRADAVWIDVAGGNTDDHLNLARIPREAEMLRKMQDRFPDVVAIHYPNSGTHFHCYIAVNQTRPGSARQALLGLLGWDPYVKTAVAVDSDVNITRDEEVLWALATQFQPANDLFVIDGLPGSPLDPSSSDGATSRLGLDATRGPQFDSRRIEFSPEALTWARAQIG